VLFRGVRDVARRLTVDVALLYLGSVRFPVTGRRATTMTARDAVELCRSLRSRIGIPVHYEGWAHFREDRAAAERELAAAPQKVRWLPIGEPVER
jgi:L-ascorbate metabolism protein UlaG (beta-lactamase superfamily)